ncbi:MAG: hypothetical protein JNL75_09060 [Chitinophagales bacterium]|nr:hypothetical protein [Chitinophagales bacterium]
MKNILIITSIALSNLVFSQSAPKKTKSIEIGMQVSRLQNDFGIGIQAATPYFANESIAFRARANVYWLDHIENGSSTWNPYMSYNFGIIGSQMLIDDRIRLYGEGGLLMVAPSEKFSTQTIHFGGYGLFGFEFLMKNSKSSYFIEIGGGGTGAKADKLPNSNIYSNGFITNAGYRVHF